MGRKRHTPEQIITALREAEVGLARGKSRAAVVGARGHRDALYRAGQPVGERLQRELQRQAQGRAVERGDLLLVGAGGRAGRAMEARVQYRPTPQRLRRLSPRAPEAIKPSPWFLRMPVLHGSPQVLELT